ncbi:hypothetical protein [Xanthomonas arboricola]|uniref:hypothetical protein n=1 Tax=Xanthomonas arboricola TaxID=56448 RepID=UPI0011AFE4BA|nr:hypothetical protein [Xanthomonas arboricola]
MKGIQRLRRSLLALAACCGLALGMPAKASSEAGAFEGLPWGATVEQIRTVFGDKLKIKVCSEQEQQKRDARPNARACGGPYVEDYTIDGITFVAFFNMERASGALSAVYLDRVATVTNQQIKAGESARSRYDRVKTVMATRYGEPLEVKEPNPSSVRAPNILHVKWQADGTIISVTDTILPDPRGQMYYLGIVYKPASE